MTDTDLPAVMAEAHTNLSKDIDAFVNTCEAAGMYMPALATILRLHADALADRFPDDTNGGCSHD